MAEAKRRDETEVLLSRLSAILTRLDIDCSCRETLNGAIDRFARLEVRRIARRRLAEARDCKDRIGAILHLLSELDQITEGESDRSVFGEMALLFDEIAASAAAGAAALRRIEA